MSEKLPWFKFFATDWITDPAVRLMTSRQKGWYIDLLCWDWQEGGLPEDPETVKGLIGYKLSSQEVEREWYGLAHRISTKRRQAHDNAQQALHKEFLGVLNMFRARLTSGRLTHPKLAQLREEKQELSAVRAKAANARWDANALHKDMLVQSTSNARQSQNQIQIAEQPTSTGIVLNSGEGFQSAAAIAAAGGLPARIDQSNEGQKAAAANGWDPVHTAILELEAEGRPMPDQTVRNEYGRPERNPAYERMNAAIERALPRIRAARMPVAFAKKVILDALKGA